jgi:hypothetical protein
LATLPGAHLGEDVRRALDLDARLDDAQVDKVAQLDRRADLTLVGALVELRHRLNRGRRFSMYEEEEHKKNPVWPDSREYAITVRRIREGPTTFQTGQDRDPRRFKQKSGSGAGNRLFKTIRFRLFNLSGSVTFHSASIRDLDPIFQPSGSRIQIRLRILAFMKIGSHIFAKKNCKEN